MRGFATRAGRDVSGGFVKPSLKFCPLCLVLSLLPMILFPGSFGFSFLLIYLSGESRIIFLE